MTLLDETQRELASHIGYREAGQNNTPFNRAFGKIPGYPHDGFGYPWCHTFLSVGLDRVGLEPGVDFPWTAGCEVGVAWFKAHDRFGRTPKVGAFVYYGAGGGTHVEWVEKVTDTTITTIGGNTSGSLAGTYHNGDGVYRKTVARSSDRIYGYGYPDYQEADMSPKEYADAVYARLTQKLGGDLWAVREGIFPEGETLDPKTGIRQIWAYGKDGYARHREALARLDAILARLDAQAVVIQTLAEALAARDEAVDVEALVAKIEAKVGAVIDGITIRLDVSEPEPPKEEIAP
ncbi:CHAP domain-containing protein [Herbidospora daliensis]|uniref:CHAP domain-containing protein n=1 Tax=Herbidospora daliensis TaxID=295585 RepID=UPI0007863BDB|nr:CHAP domain-containing protein [Herbidospora daliensis]